jgi:RHS repeat-associated protein
VFDTERITDLELNVDMSRDRTYDYLTGRWWQVDPKADEAGQESWSTYHYGFDNPVRYNDPYGDCPRCPRPAARYYSSPPNQRIVSREQIITSYKHNNRVQNMNGPRERVVVGNSENPQSLKGQVVTAMLNLADNNGLEGKLQSLQVSVMKVETVATNAVGSSNSDGGKYVFTGRDAVKLEGMENAYQSSVNSAVDQRFAAFASEKLGVDFNSLSPDAQAEFRVNNSGVAGLMRSQVEMQMGPSPKQQVIAQQQQLLQQGIVSEEVTKKTLPSINQGN